MTSSVPLSTASDIFLCMKILGEVGEKLQYHKPLGQVIQIQISSIVMYFSFTWLQNIKSFWQRPALILKILESIKTIFLAVGKCVFTLQSVQHE